MEKKVRTISHSVSLGEESNQRQVSILLYCLREEADDVLSLTNITETQRRQYSDVLSKFDSFIQVTKNMIFEWARFNSRVQQEGESAEQYIVALYNLAKYCEYGSMKSELIGICDIGLSERLQANEKLTLDKAKKAIRIKEAVHEQQELLHGDTEGNPISLDGVWEKRNMLIKTQSSNFKTSNLSRKLCT